VIELIQLFGGEVGGRLTIEHYTSFFASGTKQQNGLWNSFSWTVK